MRSFISRGVGTGGENSSVLLSGSVGILMEHFQLVYGYIVSIQDMVYVSIQDTLTKCVTVWIDMPQRIR